MPEAQNAIEIFYSYAHADRRWLKQLDTHLSALKRQGLISAWHDRLLVPGTDWEHEIDAHLAIARSIKRFSGPLRIM